MFRSGFIAVIGKPNVGKSTLINALVGEKVAITSPKPQTTRNKILGIKNGQDYQMVFLDTPGIHNGKSKLGEYLKKSTESATNGVDAIMILLDAGKVNTFDFDLIKSYENSSVPVFVVVNKVDISSYEKLYPVLAKLNEYQFVKEFLVISALKKRNLQEIERALLNILPEGPAYFPTDQYTDKNLRFMAAEIIREKALLFLQEEIPHGIAIDITTFKEGKNLIDIKADIICESDRHKQIIIGKNGAMLKKIGTSAREEIEKLVDNKVLLELFVKVREDWKENKNTLSDLGYNLKEFDD
ncbi:MAG: GTPase Era [Clostridia bacterium]|nr:GTPase Era [Clostridia bacterium]